MNLSDAQILELFDAHWQGRAANCPSCGGALDSHRSNVLGGYVLRFQCPEACEIPEFASGDDPRRPEFRDWTAAEGAKLVKDFAAKRSPCCPVCAVPVTGQVKWVFSGQLVNVRCERCRKECEDSLPR